MSGIRIVDLRTAFAELTGTLKKKLLRQALAAGAKLVKQEAQRLAPVLRLPVYRGGKLYRKPGTVKKAIAVRTSKIAKRKGAVGVFVNVRPAKGAKFKNGALLSASKRGAASPDDPFYWRWLEFGRQARGAGGVKKTKKGTKSVRAVGAIAPARFLQRAADKLPEALKAFEAALVPAIEKANRRKP